jgi:hypothetical protein
MFGPFDVQPEFVLESSENQLSSRRYINISGDVIDAGVVEYIKLNVIEHPYKKYLLIKVKDKYLFIETYYEFTGNKFVGKLTPLDSDLKEIIDTAEGYDTQILPVKLDATEDYKNYWVLLIFILIPFAIGMFNICRYTRRKTHPLEHPVYKQLRKFGDLSSIAENINNEMLGDKKVFKNIIITDNWCIYGGLYSLTICKLEDTVWVYHKTIKNKKEEHHSVKLLFSNGKYIRELFKESEYHLVESVIERACERAPWAIKGFTKEYEKMYSKKRDEFYSMVEVRKSKVKQQKFYETNS